jgi:glucosamine--fructose-6-phosphate aminotransferase (isomerizing)
LENYPAEQLGQLASRLKKGDFDRIVLTGMGSSLNAAYPTWLNLIPLPLPVVYFNTAELLHYGQSMIDARTLLWINSQSGRSIEIVRLLDSIRNCRPAFQLSMSNYLDSPMSLSADLAVPISAGDEATVSTKTYINMLAVLLLASSQLTGGDWQSLRTSMQKAADSMEDYLANWQARVDELDALLGEVDQLLILGRGASMAAVWNGSLINKEAAKCAFEGMNAADFRHGPLELASPRLTVIMLEGSPQTASLNRELALEVVRHGGKAIWLASRPDDDLPTLRLPNVHETVRPLVEILPLQMLSIAMAQRNGFEPGQFRHVGKITTQE